MAVIGKFNPQDLRDFEAQLRSFNYRLETGIGELTHRTHKLGETWGDPQFVQFQCEVFKAQQVLKIMQEAYAEVAPRLIELAAKGESIKGPVIG